MRPGGPSADRARRRRPGRPADRPRPTPRATRRTAPAGVRRRSRLAARRKRRPAQRTDRSADAPRTKKEAREASNGALEAAAEAKADSPAKGRHATPRPPAVQLGAYKNKGQAHDALAGAARSLRRAERRRPRRPVRRPRLLSRAFLRPERRRGQARLRHHACAPRDLRDRDAGRLIARSAAGSSRSRAALSSRRQPAGAALVGMHAAHQSPIGGVDLRCARRSARRPGSPAPLPGSWPSVAAAAAGRSRPARAISGQPGGRARPRPSPTIQSPRTASEAARPAKAPMAARPRARCASAA